MHFQKNYTLCALITLLVLQTTNARCQINTPKLESTKSRTAFLARLESQKTEGQQLVHTLRNIQVTSEYQELIANQKFSTLIRDLRVNVSNPTIHPDLRTKVASLLGSLCRNLPKNSSCKLNLEMLSESSSLDPYTHVLANLAHRIAGKTALSAPALQLANNSQHATPQISPDQSKSSLTKQKLFFGWLGIH